VATIPDSLPTVHSSEDWQAAFGFQPESSRTNHIIVKSSSTDTSRVPFNSEGFADEEVYINAPYTVALTEPSSSTFTSNLLVNSSASKFMADYQQNSLQQRLNIQVSGIIKFLDYVFKKITRIYSLSISFPYFKSNTAKKLTFSVKGKNYF